MAEFVKLILALGEVFVKEDCSLLEINPLVVTKQGNVVALDCQDELRRQREGRHPEWERAARHRRGRSRRARSEAKTGLSYVSLDGNIGCLVNGAGLAHGDDGHHQALRRPAGELPGRRRRRQQRAGHQGVPR